MNLAELVNHPFTTVTLPGSFVADLIRDLEAANADREALTRKAEAATTQAMKTAADLEKARTLAEDQARTIIDREKTITEQQHTIQALTKPLPIPLPPVTPTPRGLVITKSQISGLAGLTIEKGKKSPSDAMYDEVRRVMDKAAGMHFNAWRGFFNLDEVRDFQQLPATSLKHLPFYGNKLGLAFIADTVDAVMPKLDDAQLREYLRGLVAMGAQALVFNDADQYAIAVLEQWTKRVRAILPDMPLIASLRSSANIGSYPMFDFFEAQTFGSLDEVRGFLGRPFDLFCLDARKAMSAVDLASRAAVVLAAKPKAFFYYADTANDWLVMPLDEQGAIRRMIDSWKKA